MVQIFSGKKRCCLGAIVSSDGQIVTKASELNGKLTCRLSSGEEYAVKVLRTSKENDLALIKIDGGELIACSLLNASPSKFEFVAAVLPDTPRKQTYLFEKPQAAGIITQVAKSVEALPGHLGRFNNVEGGIKLFSTYLSPLQKGDIVLNINGQRTPNLDQFHQIMKPSENEVLGFPGESVEVQVCRAEQTLNLDVTLSRRPSQSLQPESDRRSGFADAFDCDLSLYPTECGAPVIDEEGSVLGIAIATRGVGYLYVVTSKALRQFLSNPPSAQIE